MALNELETFMAAMRRLESGSFGGNYSIPGPKITNPESIYFGERAYGAYQIMPGNWSAWAREAGLGDAPITSKAAQDAVAKHKFRQYYQELGDWRLVAVAWFAGMSRAKRARDRGIETVAGIKDVIGTSVGQYVEKVANFMREAVDQGYAPEVDPSILEKLDPQAREQITNRPSLSIDDPYSGFAQDAPYRPEAQGQDASQFFFGNANMTELQKLISGIGQEEEPTDEPALQGSQMHGLISGVLSGLSNAVKQSAAGAVPSSGIDTRRFDVEVD